MTSYEHVNAIKFFVLYDINNNVADVINGFMTYDEAKQFCEQKNNLFDGKLTVFAVDSADDDDKELELIRENYLYQLQEQEEEWDR